jgi:benzoyl-CoA reductase/2-hydroxyglutaryl-CoA dehydratase subunit BcrC/BadD/HgdB
MRISINKLKLRWMKMGKPNLGDLRGDIYTDIYNDILVHQKIGASNKEIKEYIKNNACDGVIIALKQKY